MTPAVVYVVITIASVIAIVAWVFICVTNAKKVSKIIGDDFKTIITGQLSEDETLLYSKRKQSNGCLFACVLGLAAIFILISFSASFGNTDIISWDHVDAVFNLVIVIIMSGLGLLFAFLGFHSRFNSHNTMYFITARRLCIRKVTAKSTKEQDIPAGTIKSVKTGIYAARKGGRSASASVVSIIVKTQDGKNYKLVPEGDMNEMAKILKEIAGIKE
jgi:cytochrome c biogenesis protein CcdA